MRSVPKAVVVVGALALVATALGRLAYPEWFTDSPPREVHGPAKAVEKRTVGTLARSGVRRGPTIFEQRAAYRDGLTEEVPRVEDPDIRRVTRVEALADFEALMTTLEARADRGLPDREEGDRIYRAANDAYTALSMMLDAKDAADAQLLETAHVQMRETLARLEIEPTTHHDAERATNKDRVRQRPGHFVPPN